MNEGHSKKTVVVCDTQPITALGLGSLLAGCDDLELLESTHSLEAASAMVHAASPHIVVVDKGFGMRAVLEWIYSLKLADPSPAVVVWGVSMTEAEALRLLQAGARGIVRKTADLASLVTCLKSVATARTWMEDCVFRDPVRQASSGRSPLTAREQQVLELVEHGFKNKEIALELGIRPGTVKIHLKHIFEKTGVRGRYGLAINGLKDKEAVPIAS